MYGLPLVRLATSSLESLIIYVSLNMPGIHTTNNGGILRGENMEKFSSERIRKVLE